MGLSSPVQAAVEEAANMVLELAGRMATSKQVSLV
jgi:hypothetical protein